MSAPYPPMLAHYRSLKDEHPEWLLFYRMGDFYEMFFEDAVLAARELELTLTGRDAGDHGRIPMAGVPHHAVETYLTRLIERGFRVAICEQMEDPRQAKGLVRREVVRVVTPGTVVEGGLLADRRNNFLAAVSRRQDRFGLAYGDLSTGELVATECQGEPQLRAELARIQPSELLVPLSRKAFEAAAWGRSPGRRGGALLGDGWDEVLPPDAPATPVASEWLAPDMLERRLCEAFGVRSLEGFGLQDRPLAREAVHQVLVYARETRRDQAIAFTGVRTVVLDDHLHLDAQTRRNLELVQTSRDGQLEGSLLSVLDRTRTAMGARCLRQWLLHPLARLEPIARRHDAVAELVGDPGLRALLQGRLESLRDLERLSRRLATGSASARDLVALKDGLLNLDPVVDRLLSCESALLQASGPIPPDLLELARRLEASLVDVPPIALTDGGLIRPGVDAHLDETRALLADGKDWLATFEAAEKARTGIKSLKIGHSRTFGYFIEVTHANREAVPEDYQRKQTLVNAERYVTPVLREREMAITTAQERMGQIEYALFTALRDELATWGEHLQDLATHVARVDALAALAEVAVRGDWVRPDLDESRALDLQASRHPVLETRLPPGRFVPNDATLDASGDVRLVVITGPNMAGKSTYMRQVALAVLLAQMGSFVPARSARIGLVDRIFTRVGAVDDLATGQSTFMVEMSETAHILRHATERSLVVLDEIGRGTSTFDGISIAWSVSEHLVEQVRARSLFATHYHELTALALSLDGVRNCRVTVEETPDGVVFLHRVVPGGADRSYGIEVARLAGLPAEVVARSRQVLAEIERRNRLSLSLRQTLRDELSEGNTAQLPLFDLGTGWS
ncbi:MAG: DNA mismatch repair protein MutS [bacterium]|nr:DNA mismatch repair protein MutS [bacterium]